MRQTLATGNQPSMLELVTEIMSTFCQNHHFAYFRAKIKRYTNKKFKWKKLPFRYPRVAKWNT